MKYWIDKDSETNNVILVNKSGIAISSCDKESLEKVESQLATKISPIEIFGTDDLLTIPYAKIQSITCRSTDEDVSVSYKAKKDIEEQTLYFQNTTDVDAFIRTLDGLVPNHLTKNAYQQSAFAAAINPIFSLLFGVALTFVYFNKFRWPAIVIGGIWIAFSAFILIKRTKNPPRITRWKLTGKYVRRFWHSIKTGASYSIAIIVALGFSLKFPDNYGPKSLHENILESTLSPEDVNKYLDRGADINYTDSDGDTPLMMAIYSENEALALKLIEAGARLDKPDGEHSASPLQYAIDYGVHLSVVKAMIEKGADLNITFGEQSLLDYVRDMENPELLKVVEQAINDTP